MPKTEEYKDKRGKNRIRHTADNGRVTYASTQGYENLSDMRETAINTAIQLLSEYRDIMTGDQLVELNDLL